MAYYFTNETQQAIIEYNNSNDPIQKEILFKNEIYPPFLKLVEILINKFKFYFINEGDLKSTQQDVISFLVTKLDRYSEEKGKAFSYFTIVARNFLIHENRKAYKRLKEKALLDENKLQDTFDEDENFILEDNIRFMNLFLEWMDKYTNKIYNPGVTRNIWNSIRERIREVGTSRDLDFSKSGLYLEIVDEYNLDGSGLIYYVISSMRKHYRFKKLFWIKRGYFDPRPPKPNYKPMEEWMVDL